MNGFAQTAAKQLKVNLRRVGSVGDNEKKHNKSLDASGGGVFRIKLLPVIKFQTDALPTFGVPRYGYK